MWNRLEVDDAGKGVWGRAILILTAELRQRPETGEKTSKSEQLWVTFIVTAELVYKQLPRTGH